MLRNSEIVGNMIPNNYPNSDFYSVFPDSNILSEPKLANISDISNTHEEAQLALGNISTGDLLSDLQVETP